MNTSKENGKSNKTDKGISDEWWMPTWNIIRLNRNEMEINEKMTETGYISSHRNKKKTRNKARRTPSDDIVDLKNGHSQR